MEAGLGLLQRIGPDVSGAEMLQGRDLEPNVDLAVGEFLEPLPRFVEMSQGLVQLAESDQLLADLEPNVDGGLDVVHGHAFGQLEVPHRRLEVALLLLAPGQLDQGFARLPPDRGSTEVVEPFADLS